jgi:hypothetical protein
LEAVSNSFINVIHHSVLRSDSGREENLDAAKCRIRLTDATFPPHTASNRNVSGDAATPVAFHVSTSPSVLIRWKASNQEKSTSEQGTWVKNNIIT